MTQRLPSDLELLFVRLTFDLDLLFVRWRMNFDLDSSGMTVLSEEHALVHNSIYFHANYKRIIKLIAPITWKDKITQKCTQNSVSNQLNKYEIHTICMCYIQ